MESFDYSGYWWLPENEDSKRCGNLSFSNGDGLYLEIFGSFSSNLPAHYPVIKGRTLEGKNFTLFDCDVQRLNRESEGISAEYAFESVVAGMGKIPPDSRSFHKAFVRYTHLPDWIDSTGFQRKYISNELLHIVDRLELIYQVPEKVNADVEGTRISIVEGYKYEDKNLVTQGAHLCPVFSFKIEAEQKLSFEAWREKFVGPLGDFLTLDTGQPNSVTRLSFQSRSFDLDLSEDNPKVSITTVYYRQITARVPRKTSVLRIQNMLFSFQDIKDEYPHSMQAWITIRAKFAKSMTLFFAVKNSSGMYLEHEFLTQVQALEIYHRERFKSTVASEIVEEHLAKTKAVVDTAPKEYREWLDDQLNLDRQVRLNQRLLELLGHSEPVISRLVKNGEVFAKRVTKTRNFLTHYSSKSKGVMEELELYRATQVISYMLQACIMLELDFPIEKIVGFFERNQQFKFVENHIKQAHDWS